MYTAKQIQISKENKINACFDELYCKANELHKKTCFYIRQWVVEKYTFKVLRPLFEYKIKICNLVERIKDDFKFHSYKQTACLGYNCLNYIFSVIESDDYYTLPTRYNFTYKLIKQGSMFSRLPNQSIPIISHTKICGTF